MATTPTTADELTESVRDHYARTALGVLESSGATAACCDDGCCGGTDTSWGATLYDVSDRASLPDAAVLASLGCGNPTAVADLQEGDRVLDLGSGGGIDVLLSAQRVGPTGRAFGLDMTDEMLALAQRNAADAGATNVEFLKGHMEAIPLPAGSIDVVISNCVINLSADKPAVLAEMARVLRPGGRIGISDVVADDAPDRRAARRARQLRGLHRGGPLVRRVPPRAGVRRLPRCVRDADPPSRRRHVVSPGHRRPRLTRTPPIRRWTAATHGDDVRRLASPVYQRGCCSERRPTGDRDSDPSSTLCVSRRRRLPGPVYQSGWYAGGRPFRVPPGLVDRSDAARPGRHHQRGW